MKDKNNDKWLGCPYYIKCKESKITSICETNKYNQCEIFEEFLKNEYYP